MNPHQLLQIKYTKKIKIFDTYENATTTVVLEKKTKCLLDIASFIRPTAQ
jgi:hypothetical protein